MRKEIMKGIMQFEGVKVINVTPHPVTLKSEKTGEEFDIPNSGILLNASLTETKSGERNGVQLVRIAIQGNEEGVGILDSIPADVIVIGSVIAAQGYPGRVMAMTPAKGYERVPPAEKRMNLFKYTIF